MVIGFAQRIRTVFENDVVESEFTTIGIDVATQRAAEREHPMIFRLWSSSRAIVESGDDLTIPLLDAAFGIRTNGHIQQEFRLQPLQDTIPPLLVKIIDDFRAESEECFAIRIFQVNVPGRRELFFCNEDDSEATSFFCETTICIQDEGGICFRYHPQNNLLSCLPCFRSL